MTISFYDTKPYDKKYFNIINEQYGFTINYFETKLSARTAKLAEGSDAVCAFVNDDVSAPTVDALNKLGIKIIAMRCAGYNNVDIRYAQDKIPVVRVPAYSPHAVAEHAMALLLTLNRRIHKAFLRTRDFNFSLNGLTGFDLYGKTVGVVGTGKIGSAFIDICRGFGMKVLAYDVFPNVENVEYTDMDTLLKSSDLISLHCPLTPSTRHIINAKSIDKMKKGVFIVNTSRGALIDSEALLYGLLNEKLGGACLDVYEEESDLFYEDNSATIVKDDILSRLICLPNVIVTSHQGFLTGEALTNIASTTLENVSEFFADGSLDNQILMNFSKNTV
ncbi:MAG: 2-hydroxyacid dehydrogenase [Clostridiaceae bacterium]|nr:2-hydroxyacid dehydrogenase [Clostridiaceae bacterium]MDY5889458.1 2-hydroxyacid dehydrogenase [Oscillospiraceae bacterium]